MFDKGGKFAKNRWTLTFKKTKLIAQHFSPQLSIQIRTFSSTDTKKTAKTVLTF